VSTGGVKVVDVVVFVARHHILQLINDKLELFKSSVVHSSKSSHATTVINLNNQPSSDLPFDETVESIVTTDFFSHVSVGESMKGHPSVFRFDYCELLALTNNSTDPYELQTILKKWSTKLSLTMMDASPQHSAFELLTSSPLPEVSLDMMSHPSTLLLLKKYKDSKRFVNDMSSGQGECDLEHASVFPSPRMSRHVMHRPNLPPIEFTATQKKHFATPEVEISLTYAHLLPPDFVA
jgi:hypothetical protein